MAGHKVSGKKEESTVESKSSSRKGQMVQENDGGNKGSRLVLTKGTDRKRPKKG